MTKAASETIILRRILPSLHSTIILHFLLRICLLYTRVESYHSLLMLLLLTVCIALEYSFLTCHCSLILVRRGRVSSPQHNRHFLLFYCNHCLHMHPGDVLILGNLSVSWRFSALRARDGGCSTRGCVSL